MRNIDENTITPAVLASPGGRPAPAWGEPLFVQARVRGRDGEPVASAQVDVWQADAEGLYDVQRDHLAAAQGRGVLRTDAAGRLWFRSVCSACAVLWQPAIRQLGLPTKNTGEHWYQKDGQGLGLAAGGAGASAAFWRSVALRVVCRSFSADRWTGRAPSAWAARHWPCR
jgi:hypothetical protein